ncbi:MAG: hypothetical protein HUJ93_02795 [Bacteroidales bacterium]|nr:hypothetical protein [Bacteroidales bacterium]
MMSRRIISAIVLLVISFGACALEGDYKSRLSRDSILIGDQIDWSVIIDIKKGEVFELTEPEETPVPGVETISKMVLDTLKDKKDMLQIEAKMVVTSFDSGSYQLPDLVGILEHTDGTREAIVFEGPALEVTTIPIDTATYEIKDIKGQMTYPITFRELLPWFGLALLLAAIVWAAVRYIRHRRENRTFFGRPVVKDPAHIVALRELEKIRRQKLWQSDKQKQYYTEVTDTLREYIAERYGIATMERPSGEMLYDLRAQGVDAALYDEISDLFSRADLVKFAKYEATKEENEEAVPTAVRFVNSTYLQEIETN